MNIEELFDNELYHSYGMLTTEDANCLINYLKSETMEYIAELQKELAEEARLNGMGAEREAKLLARVAELEAQLPKVVKPHIEIVDCVTDTVDLDFCDCGSEVAWHEDYCSGCGSKLDWSES